jgi:hypothetical protein
MLSFFGEAKRAGAAPDNRAVLSAFFTKLLRDVFSDAIVVSLFLVKVRIGD